MIMDTDIAQSSSKEQMDTDDANQKITDDLFESQIKNDILVIELKALQSKYKGKVEDTVILQQQHNNEALKKNLDLKKALTEANKERDDLRDELHQIKEREDGLVAKIDEEIRQKEEIRSELEVSRERIEVLIHEKSEQIKVLSENLESLKSVKEGLARVIESLDGNKNKTEKIVDECDVKKEEFSGYFVELKGISQLANEVESKLGEYQEMRKKEKRELENSVVSLTEENRDINSLLRIALVEKEGVEKRLNRLKGSNDQKRVAILQIAERGLQKVGFGFMMGGSANESSLDNSSGASTGSKSDGSECEEEVVSLASTVERIMKNLRLEITQLRRSLDESRYFIIKLQWLHLFCSSDTERLQSLTEKQAQKLLENTVYIKELEDRDTMLSQNVEALLIEMRETEEEVARWREACELEVEAGKNGFEERDRVELDKTKAELNISNGKLKLKEELTAAAMAAQSAAEKSLQLADRRAVGLCERIEEMAKQLEDVEKRERTYSKVRHICWPWRALKFNPANATNTTARNVKHMLPEMQPLFH